MENTKKDLIDWGVAVFNYDPTEHVITLDNWAVMPDAPLLPIAWTPRDRTSFADFNITPYLEEALKKLVDSANAYLALEQLQKDPAYAHRDHR